MNKIYTLAIIIIYIIISALLVYNRIDAVSAYALYAFWTVLYFLLVVGVDSVSEITAGQLKIRRDLRAAQKIREEISEIAKLVVENEFILGNSSFLAMGGDSEAGEKLEKNLDRLAILSYGSKSKADEWWEKIQTLYDDRRNSSTKD